MERLRIRPARAGDWEAVAEIHARSWQSAYRGIYPNAWLEDEALDDRRSYWRGMLAELDPEQDAVFLAEEEGRPLGFSCLLRKADPAGPLLDNLHVLPERKGEGIGGRLFREAARWLVEKDPEAPLQLFVWKGNVAARRFYAGLGGAEVEEFPDPLPDGGTAAKMRIRWERAASLAALPPSSSIP